MRPLFTVHVGEYLVGSHIEQQFKKEKLNVWIPSTDTGIDLLVSDHRNRRTVSLQVKFGKDFLPTHMPADFRGPLRACSWFAINRDKLRGSQADFWVFVLSGFQRQSSDFVVVPKREFERRLRLIHGLDKKMIQSYLWGTERNRCWEARNLEGGKADQCRIRDGEYRNPVRDVSPVWFRTRKRSGRWCRETAR